MRLFAIIGVLACMTACTAPPVSSPPRAGHLSNAEVLRHISAHSAGASFLSHNGQWQGTDCDRRITFTKDGGVKVTNYGYGVDHYQGTWQADATGAIRVSLRGYHAPWPVTYLYTGRRGAFLLASGRSADSAYWPYRETKEN